jgi:succinate dehydrogenase/fumarate reductase flavoprotein subunit
MDPATWRPEKGFRYQIPYRILVPQKVENLLAAGRCVSVTHVALGSIRVMVQCALTGEAAGAASALSLRAGVVPRKVDVAALQAELRAHDGILDEADVARVNAGQAWFWGTANDVVRL